MPDIAMCIENNCPRSRECLRHADSGTEPGMNQTWEASNDVNNCDYFIAKDGAK